MSLIKMTLPEFEPIVDERGFFVHPETGEVLGHSGVAEEFIVDDVESCNWVLGRMLEAEAEIAAVDNDAAVLAAQAVLANAESIRKEKARRLAWLHARFDDELGEFARKQLVGKKERTYKTVLGSIGIRTVRGGLRLAEGEEDLAIQIAEQLKWRDAVKVTKKFLITGLTQDQRQWIASRLRTRHRKTMIGGKVAQAFVIKPDEEKVDVKTGVPR